MTYAGTVTVTKIAKNILKILAEDFDADAEEAIIDLRTYRMEGAQDFIMHINRTAGAQDVVSVQLNASNYGSNFRQLLSETSYIGWSAATSKSCQQIQIKITTIGSGNTLDVHIYATIR